MFRSVSCACCNITTDADGEAFDSAAADSPGTCFCRRALVLLGAKSRRYDKLERVKGRSDTRLVKVPRVSSLESP